MCSNDFSDWIYTGTIKHSLGLGIGKGFSCPNLVSSRIYKIYLGHMLLHVLLEVGLGGESLATARLLADKVLYPSVDLLVTLEIRDL